MGADFWRLWLVGTLQFSVRWLDILAIGVFVYQSTASAFLVTTLTMLRMLPMALFGAFAGAITDRFEGRRILLVTLSISLLSATALALLAHTGYLSLAHIGLASVAAGTVWTVELPLRRLLMGQIVAATRMTSAMALDAGASNATRIAGPAIGGVALGIWGIGGCFAIGAAMYAAALIAAVGIRHRRASTAISFGEVLNDILAVLRRSMHDKRLAGFFAVTVVFNVFGIPLLSLVPVIGQDYLGLGSRGIGLLASMEGVGAISGAFAFFFWAPPRFYVQFYVYGVVVFLIGLMTMAWLPSPSLAGLALIVGGLGGVAFGVMQSTLVFYTMAANIRPHVFGLLTVAIGVSPLGFLQAGLLAEIAGVQNAILISGTEGLVVLFLTRRWWRKIGTGDEDHRPKSSDRIAET